MAKTTQKTRSNGSRLKAELQAAAQDRIDQGNAVVAAARVRPDAAASDEERQAAQAEFDAASAEVGRQLALATEIAGSGTIAEVMARQAPAGERVVVTVIGPAKGRRRAGYQFGAAPVTVSVTAEELGLIEADADLAVTPGALMDVALEPGAPAERLPVEAFLDGKGNVRPVKVLGPAKGRRRAGYEFGAQAVTIEPTRDELELILADADLSVSPA
ncbi:MULTISPECIES: hypothetical protein [unclassified Mesorhizobium]|uniref:hypothetical protein n=1 Tax=unclassified Mesorhizobium TaxID=325217 RepID=UPI0006F9E21F|nr:MULTISPECIES: hypothetical protein [unclassified Mesorhizobium]